MSAEARRPLLIDTDAGIDDAQAILMALGDPDVKVVAITTVHGNTDNAQCAKNVLRLLKEVGRMDIPVYLGCNTSLMGHSIKATHYHGLDGFGDVPDPEAPGLEHAQKEHAVNAIVRLAQEYKGELNLVCLAPLTNIAMALRIEPQLPSMLKHCYIMGGNYQGKGNFTPSAEFNFYSDPEAADICLREVTCPISIACWELCLDSAFTWAWYENFISQDSKIGRFLKKIEANTLKQYYQKSNSDLPYLTADQAIMAAILDPVVIREKKRVRMRVEVTGAQTRGQGVIDWQAADGNVTLITGLHVEKYGQMLNKIVNT